MKTTGAKPYWKEVKFVPVPSAGPRLTGLLSGDFDMIENPAARDLPRLKDNPKFGFVATPSTRLVFFQPDVGRNPSPFVKSADGKNPLQDLRVRKAISMAIDRKTITARIMDGMATPAFQYMPDGMFGALPQAPEIKFDPEGAKKLLAEAGYPNGFELTLSSTNDRYVNDGQVAQAVAQYLARVGIKTNVDAMTASIYFPKRAKREFSFSMGGWPAETGEASALFQLWVASLDSPNSLGTSNYGGFSNADFDKVYKEAIVTVDAAKREKLLQQSTQIALDNVPLIPLHFESSIWAFRKGITYEAVATSTRWPPRSRPKRSNQVRLNENGCPRQPFFLPPPRTFASWTNYAAALPCNASSSSRASSSTKASAAGGSTRPGMTWICRVRDCSSALEIGTAISSSRRRLQATEI